MKEKAEFNHQNCRGFRREIIFFKSEPKKTANLQGFSTLKKWFEINLVILLTWIRIRIHQILWTRVRIQSMRILITEKSIKLHH